MRFVAMLWLLSGIKAKLSRRAAIELDQAAAFGKPSQKRIFIRHRLNVGRELRKAKDARRKMAVFRVPPLRTDDAAKQGLVR